MSLRASRWSIMASLDERGIFVISNVAKTPYCRDFLVLNLKLLAGFLVYQPSSLLSYIHLLAVFDGICLPPVKLIFLGSQFSVIHFVPCTVHFSAVLTKRMIFCLFHSTSAKMVSQM